MADRATAYLAKATGLLLADLVVAEMVDVLELYYRIGRDPVAGSVRSLLAFESVTAVDVPLLLRAIEVYEVDRIDFAEAYLVACAERTGVNRIASFDRSIDRLTTIERIEPG